MIDALYMDVHVNYVIFNLQFALSSTKDSVGCGLWDQHSS